MAEQNEWAFQQNLSSMGHYIRLAEESAQDHREEARSNVASARLSNNGSLSSSSASRRSSAFAGCSINRSITSGSKSGTGSSKSRRGYCTCGSNSDSRTVACSSPPRP